MWGNDQVPCFRKLPRLGDDAVHTKIQGVLLVIITVNPRKWLISLLCCIWGILYMFIAFLGPINWTHSYRYLWQFFLKKTNWKQAILDQSRTHSLVLSTRNARDCDWALLSPLAAPIQIKDTSSRFENKKRRSDLCDTKTLLSVGFWAMQSHPVHTQICFKDLHKDKWS